MRATMSVQGKIALWKGKAMRIGRINGYSAENFDSTKASGLEFIEICSTNQEAVKRIIDSVDSIAEQIKRTGIDVSSVGRWNHNLLADGKIVAESLDLYKAHLDAAIKLGAKTYVCGCNFDSSISLFKNYSNAIEVLGTLTEHAKGSGTRVAVHNCNWNNFIVSPEEWKIVLGELPELGIKFDASHAFLAERDYLDELSDWCERVYHVHIKGMVRAGERKVDDPPAGMDAIKWGPLFAILYSRGYDGDLSIEPHSAIWHGERGEAGVEFTKKFIKNFIV